MTTSDIENPKFRAAVKAIDVGNIRELKRMLGEHPSLLTERLFNGEQGYFKDPYLLYFVADNPIRMERLPENIVEVTIAMVEELKKLAVVNLQEQLDYTLGLVATGRIPRECGYQLAMMEVLLQAGGKPGDGLGALAHGNIDAARLLIERGGTLSLGTAVGLERAEDIRRIAPMSGQDERLVALTVAAFYGKVEWIRFLLALGVDPNGYPKPTGFHTHATPVHQAVSSGSLSAVKLLVEAGADLTLKDKAHNGTPLGWAKYMQSDESPDIDTRNRYAAIAQYLDGRN